MERIKKFINSIEVENTAKVVKHVLGDVEEKIENYTKSELEKFVLDKQPDSYRAIVTICYVIGAYAKWLDKNYPFEGNTLLELVNSIDKKQLWKKIKPTARKKFVTYPDLKRVIKDIELFEEFNELYYKTLFRCIYEGIYCEDMSVLKNLRGSDVHGNSVTLREDNGNVYNLTITSELASDIVELSHKQIWERRNRYGVCRVDMRGIYSNSVFKVEERKSANTQNDKVRFCYYDKLRKICERYLDNNISPFQLYISGVMYRIVTKLKEQNININDAMSLHNRDKNIQMIIQEELTRSNYGSELGNFKEIVRGHSDIFDL